MVHNLKKLWIKKRSRTGDWPGDEIWEAWKVYWANERVQAQADQNTENRKKQLNDGSLTLVTQVLALSRSL